MCPETGNIQKMSSGEWEGKGDGEACEMLREDLWKQNWRVLVEISIKNVSEEICSF